MNLSIVLDIYKLKLKVFFGAFRTSKASLALLAMYALGFLPSVLGFSTMITNFVKEGNANIESYVEILAAIISGFISLILLYVLRGYTAFEYEQNLIFTSPITPRKFLYASLFAELTQLLPFAHPIFILFGAAAYSLGMQPLSALFMLLIIILFIFTLLFLKTSLSIINSLYRGLWLKVTMLALAILSLLPALLGFPWGLPLRYNSLPHPSTFLIKTLINIVYGESPQLLDIIGLLSYFLFSLALFTFASGKNFFQHATYVPFVSPFDTSMRMQTIKMERTIRTFSRMGQIFTLNIESKSLLGLLMRKEMIRMLRDGSLFSVVLIYAVIMMPIPFIYTAGTQENGMPTYIFLTFFIGSYSLIVPLMLVSNWRFSEFENIWIPLTSGINPLMIAKALLYDFILIASLIPAIVVSIFSVIYNVSPLLPLLLIISTSTIGSSVNLHLMTKFFGKKRRGTPSLLIGWVSMLLSGLLLTPTYIFITLSIYLKLNDAMNAFISIPILAYSILITRRFLKKSGGNIINIEI